jgi:hypothetical protein
VLEPGATIRIPDRIDVPAAAAPADAAPADAAPPAAALPVEMAAPADAAVDEHPIRLSRETRVRVAVNSTEIDPVLEIVDPDSGDVVAYDDDGGEGLNSLTYFTARRDGVHLFRVRSLGGTAGAYELVVEALPPLPDPAVLPAPSLRVLFSTADGALAEGDARAAAWFDDYYLTMAAGNEAIIRLQSFDFDPWVAIARLAERDGAEIAFATDLAGGGGAMLLFRAEEAGDYVVRVSSAGERQTGRYRLWVGRPVR